MKVIAILLAVTISTSPILFSNGEKVKMIIKLVEDLIQNENVPSVLSAFTCWSTTDNFYFMKSSKVVIQLSSSFQLSRRISDDSTNKQWYFIDMNCKGSYEFLYSIEEAYFAHPYRWILLEPIEDRLRNLTFLTDSNVIIINFNQEFNRYGISQVYKIDREQSFIFEQFGYWSKETGLVDLRETRILSRRRRDLRGKILKSVAIVTRNDSIGHMHEIKNSNLDFPSKLSYVITNLLAESLNASISYKYVNTWGYGDMTDPKKLGGMMGPLARNEIDVTGTVLFITADRVPHVEFLSVTLPLSFAFVFRAPPLSHVSNIYYLPFDSIVWICAIVLVILSTLVTYIIYQFSQDHNEDLKSSDFLLFAVSTVCQMGSYLMPKRSSGKIATFVFCLSLIFIYTSYTANIVALLQSTSDKIRTLSGLLNSNMELSVEDTPYARHYFANQIEPIRKKIYESKIVQPNQPDRFTNVSYGVSMMQKGLNAFHMELSTGYKYVADTFYEHEKCGLVEIRYLQENNPWHGAPKKSPFKEIFKISLSKLREHGIQSIEKARRKSMALQLL